MKNLKLTLILLVVSTFQSCNEDTDCVPATGEVMEEEFSLDPFDKVSLEIAANVFIRKGAEQQILIEAQRSVVDLLLQTSVTEGDWKIRLDQCINTSEEIRIYITLPSLEEINISGSGDVVVEDTFVQNSVSLRTSGSGSISGDFEVSSMECAISGSGGMTVKGRAQAAEIRISGSGNVEAFDLPTVICEVSISGSGSASVNVSDRLEVSIAGSGSVSYKGSPTIDSSISGSGRIIDAN